MDLVTTGDIVIASERAEFFDPHVSIGLVSGREMVRRRPGRCRSTSPCAWRCSASTSGMSAQRAFDLGLVTEVVEHDRLADRAAELAETGQPQRTARGARHPARDPQGPRAPALRGGAARRGVPGAGPAHRRRRRRSPRVPRASRPELGMPSDLRDDPLRRRRRESRVATITLNRPERLNAFNRAMCEEISRRLARGQGRRLRHAVVLRAAGDRAFSAGLDVQESFGQPELVWNHVDPGGLAGPEGPHVLEAGRVRGARDLHGRRLLLRQRGRRRDLLRPTRRSSTRT